jgi:outer membrane biosynthesis protein TonB
VKKFTAVAVAVLALSLTACQSTAPAKMADVSPVAPVVITAPTQAPATAPACEEDEPCWDCKTMGNKLCGPVAPEPAPAVVAPAPVPAPVAPAPAPVKKTAPAPAVKAPAPVKAETPAPAPTKAVEAPVAPAKVEIPAPVRCEEDMPCWDCKTMGNKVCGPQVPVDDYVTPCKMELGDGGTTKQHNCTYAPQEVTANDCAEQALWFDAKTKTCEYKEFAPSK